MRGQTKRKTRGELKLIKTVNLSNRKTNVSARESNATKN